MSFSWRSWPAVLSRAGAVLPSEQAPVWTSAFLWRRRGEQRNGDGFLGSGTSRRLSPQEQQEEMEGQGSDKET